MLMKVGQLDAPRSVRYTERHLHPTTSWSIEPFLAFVAYTALAVWMRAGLGYGIGDALARNSSARVVLFATQPKLTAIGFVWPPLPTLAQLPFVLILEPFHLAQYAGPMSTVMFGVGTVVVLLRLVRTLGVDPRLGRLLVVMYAFNPVVAFHAANGMSESAFFFFIAVACLGLLGWLDQRRMVDLAILGVGLCGMTLCRWESFFVVPVFAVAAGMCTPTWRTRCRVTFVAVLPAIVGQFVWMFTSKLIVGSWLFGFDTPGGPGNLPGPTAPWLPRNRNLDTGTLYSLKLSGLLGGGMLLVALGMFVRRRLNRTQVYGALCLIAIAAEFPAYQAYTIGKNTAWGDPRYFSTIMLFSVVLALWATSQPTGPVNAVRPFERSGAGLGLTSVLVTVGLAMNCILGPIGLSNTVRTTVEQEWAVFRPLLGMSGAPDRLTQSVKGWQSFTSQVDSILGAANSRALIDMLRAFPVMLLTDDASRLIGDSDSRFEALVAANGGVVNFAVTGKGVGTMSFLNDATTWSKVVETPEGILWHRVGANG